MQRQQFLAIGFVLVLSQSYNIEAKEIIVASVSFNEPDKPKINGKKLVLGKPAQKKWHELHGSLNNRYVYLVVKKTGTKDITGYLFDGKGKKEYVYGEWFDQQLLIYDQSNNRLNVLLHK